MSAPFLLISPRSCAAQAKIGGRSGFGVVATDAKITGSVVPAYVLGEIK